MNLLPDRIALFLDDCHDAGIKNPVGFLQSKMPQVYSYLKGAFPRGILPTDIDGEVELDGEFLRLEFKHESVLNEGRLPKGQAMAFRRLVVDKGFTVFVIGINDAANPTLAHVWYRASGNLKTYVKQLHGGRNDLHTMCRNWTKWVEKKSTPPTA